MKHMLFTDQLIRSLGWMLVHSLWLGLASAVLAGALMIATRRSAPTLRYLLLLVLMGFFITASGISFYLSWQQAPGPATVDAPSFGGAAVAVLSWLGVITRFMEQYAGWLVACWMMVVTIRFI